MRPGVPDRTFVTLGSRFVPEDPQIPRVEIKVRDRGPYKVTGAVRVIDPEGAEFELDGETIALCRCGESSTKPFCDGSHRSSDFDSCVRAGGDD